MSTLDQWLTGRTQQTAYKRRQTATFTHLKIHRADSTELSQHISQLSSCQCLSLSLSQSLNSRLRTALFSAQPAGKYRKFSLHISN